MATLELGTHEMIYPDPVDAGGIQACSRWLEYFAPAVQLGLTATPKRKDNVDTYRYFGEPVFIYSLKDGINDGFLTPFKVKQIQTTLDYYTYTPDDTVVEGEIEAGRIYEEADFNRNIEIREREKKRVEIFMAQINQQEKTLVFGANQAHALLIRDLINQAETSTDPNYCQRVTANDGALGEQHLRAFQDNEKTIPTILTTSQKLSTGVDARTIRNLVLLRPITSMIEFKQIIGRGTRRRRRRPGSAGGNRPDLRRLPEVPVSTGGVKRRGPCRPTDVAHQHPRGASWLTVMELQEPAKHWRPFRSIQATSFFVSGSMFSLIGKGANHGFGPSGVAGLARSWPGTDSRWPPGVSHAGRATPPSDWEPRDGEGAGARPLADQSAGPIRSAWSIPPIDFTPGLTC